LTLDLCKLKNIIKILKKNLMGLNFKFIVIWKALSKMSTKGSAISGVRIGSFGTDSYCLNQNYTNLMNEYWKAKNSGLCFDFRLHQTVSNIFRVMGIYDTVNELLNHALQCQHPNKDELTLIFVLISISLMVQSPALCTSDNLGALFAHIFEGADLEVDDSEVSKFQSAINRVAVDFAKEPAAGPFSTDAGSEALTGQPLRRGGRGGLGGLGGRGGRGCAVAGSGAEFEADMKNAIAAAPQNKAQLMIWLTELQQ
jgi:hypothetical protein